MTDKHRFDLELQPDIKGYMAATGTTFQPMGICPSCLRSNIYGLMVIMAMVRTSLIDAEQKLTRAVNTHPANAFALAIQALADVKAADEKAQQATSIIGSMVKLDMVSSLPGAEDLSEEDWAIAMQSFYQARSEFYIRDGKIHYEPHPDEEDDDEPDDDGIVTV